MSLPIELTYAPEHTARILRQPSNQPRWITNTIGHVNTYRPAMEHGCLGILAHNHLDGKHFHEIQPYHIVEVTYDDDWIKWYDITKIYRFRATRPKNPHSSFVSIDDVGLPVEVITPRMMFDQMYAANIGKLVIQTCISLGKDKTWGRIYIIGKLVDQTTK